MALSFSLLEASSDVTDLSSYTTGSFSPTANRLQLLVVSSGRVDSTNPAAPTVTGCNMLWVQVRSLLFKAASTARQRITIYRALRPNPSTGALTIDFAGATQAVCAWHWIEVDGTDLSGSDGAGAIVQSADTGAGLTGTSGSVTLAAFGDATNNAAFGVWAHNTPGEVTAPEGGSWVEIADTAPAGSGSAALESEYLIGQDTSVTASWSTSSAYGGIAAEIKMYTGVTATSVIRATGFEYGFTPVTTGNGLIDDIATSNSTPAISSSIKRSGGYSLQLKTVAGVGEGRCGFTIGSGSQIIASLWFYIATLPSTSVAYICNFYDSAFGTTLGINVSSAGVVGALIGAGTQRNGPTITTATWNRLDLLGDFTGTTWTLDWMVNGVAYTQATEGSHVANNGTKYLYLRSGSPTMSGTSDLYIDDVAVSLARYDYPLGERIILLAPIETTAAHQSITTTEWQTTSDFSGFTNFTGASETTSAPLLADTSLTTGIRINTTGAAAGNARWGIGLPVGAPASTPEIVTAVIGVREASTGTNNATFRSEFSGSTTNIFSADPAWGTTFNYLKSVMTTAPGGTAWTGSNIDTLNFEADSTDASPNIWLNHVSYEVCYPAVGSPHIWIPTAAVQRASSW